MEKYNRNKLLRPLWVKLHDRQELLRIYLSDAPYGGLIISCKELLEEGDLVEVQLTFIGSFEIHRIRGAILWCRKAAAIGFEAAVGFLITETARRERLMALSA